MTDARPRLYLDLASPYAYLAFARVHRLFPGGVIHVPVLVGAIFAQRGHGSWALTPARAEGMAEIESRAARYGLPPLVWPPHWPANSLTAGRAAVWAQRRGRLVPFLAAVYRAEFTEGADIADPGVLGDAARVAGLDPAELGDAVAAEEVKAALRAATDAAWARGVRGVPTLEWAGRLFFGDDQLEHAAALSPG